MSELTDVAIGKDAIIGMGKEGGDASPRLYYTSKMIPGGAGIIRFFDVFTSDIQYSTQQY